MLCALSFFYRIYFCFSKSEDYVFIWISIMMLLTERTKFYRPLKSSETTERNNLEQFFFNFYLNPRDFDDFQPNFH